MPQIRKIWLPRKTSTYYMRPSLVDRFINLNYPNRIVCGVLRETLSQA
jgi:hypothetical protein